MLRKMDYYNGVDGFINYAVSYPKNISGDSIKCLCKRNKNKKNFSIQKLLQCIFYKKGLWKNTCVGLHMENLMFLTRT
jgi:hypothetical protein